MSEGSKGLVASAEHNKVGPNYFGFYAREVAELLSQDKDFLLCSSQTSGVSARIGREVRDKEIVKHGCVGKETKSSTSSDALFSNGIGAGISDFKNERLKALLRQSVSSLTQEVDEMLDPVLSIRQIKAQLRYKKHQSCNSSVISDDCAGHSPYKKLKMSSSSHFSCGSGIECFGKESEPLLCLHTGDEKENGEVNDDMKFLLKNRSLVEERVEKYSHELSGTLGFMEQQLEELLDVVMSHCRPMTRHEKYQLQKMIEKLPPKNLGRAAEIIQRSKPPETHTCDEIHVNLEKEDNATLWRLYYYVEAVEKARKLSR